MIAVMEKIRTENEPKLQKRIWIKNQLIDQKDKYEYLNSCSA